MGSLGTSLLLMGVAFLYGLTGSLNMADIAVRLSGMSSPAMAVAFGLVLAGLGIKAGLVKIRAFRPFPARELIQVLSNVKAIGVLDRSGAYGSIGGPIFNEVRSLLYDLDERPYVTDYIYGLGGRDMSTTMITGVYHDLSNIAKTGTVKQRLKFIGVR